MKKATAQDTYPELESGRSSKQTAKATAKAVVNKPQYLIVHHTGGTNANPNADTSHHTFDGVNAYHKSLWNFRSSLGFYIGYHQFCEKLGRSMTGRADTDEGAHTVGKNSVSLGYCWALNGDIGLPTEAQKADFKRWAVEKMVKYNIPLSKVVPHRTFAVKSCYGSKLSESYARDLARIGLQEELKRLVDSSHNSISSVQTIIKLLG